MTLDDRKKKIVESMQAPNNHDRRHEVVAAIEAWGFADFHAFYVDGTSEAQLGEVERILGI